MVAGENSTEELKRQHQALKTASVKLRMEIIDSTLPSDLLGSVNQSRIKGASSWLTTVPLVEQGLVLNKQEFRDSLRLRYNMPLSDLPSKHVCGEKYTVCHALSCKKGGFVAQRHDGVRKILTSLIGEVCTNVEVEIQLQRLDNEWFNLRSVVTSPQSRQDFKAGGFWSRGVTAFFDVIVTHVNTIWTLLPFNKYWHFQICIAKSIHSYKKKNSLYKNTKTPLPVSLTFLKANGNLSLAKHKLAVPKS